MSLDFNHLWEMDDDNQLDALIVAHVDRSQFEEGRKGFRRLITGEFHPATPIIFRYHMGSEPKDLIATAYPPRYLLSERVIRALHEHALTGWSTYPVRLYGKTGKEIVGYRGFAITGKGGPADLSRSCIVEVPFRGKTVQRLKGLYFNQANWDGTDVFLVEGKGYICITEKTYKVLANLHATNVAFRRLSEIEAPM